MPDNTTVFEPLQGLVQGMIQGHQIHQMILNSSLQQEAEQRRAMQQERDNQIEDIGVQQKLMDNSDPVDAAGMVTTDGTLGKILGGAGGASDNPGKQAASGMNTGENQTQQFVTKADRSRTVDWHGRQYQLRTSAQQLNAKLADKAQERDAESTSLIDRMKGEEAAKEPYRQLARTDTETAEKARIDATQAGEDRRNKATIDAAALREQDNVTEGKLAAAVAKGSQPGATQTDILKAKAADQTLKRMTADKVAARPVTNVYAPTAPPVGADGKPRASTIADAPAGLRSQIQSVLDYGTKLPPSSRLNPTNQAIRQWVTQINPDYRESDYEAKSKIAQDFSASGASGKAITSSDTALSHLSKISEAGKALKSGDLTQLNRLATFVGAQTGNAAPTVYDSIVETVAPEISKAVIGGAGGEADRQRMAAGFSRNLSDQAREGAIGANVSLLRARLQKMGEAYQSDMGRPLARKLSPESQAVVDRYSGGAGGSGAGISVTVPGGKSYSFPNQAAADKFKAEAGIQ